MKRVLGFFAILILIVCGVLYTWSQRIANGRNLPQEGSVLVHIDSGGITIAGTRSPEFRVSLEGSGSNDAQHARIDIDRDAKPVRIRIADLPQGTRARVEVPENSNLAVQMGAGELTITNVHGDKFATLRAGQLIVDIGDRAEYSDARASVLAGAIHAPAFSSDKGGLFRFLHLKEGGPRRLNAHVTSGEVVLR